jgi:hypothetical protein
MASIGWSKERIDAERAANLRADERRLRFDVDIGVPLGGRPLAWERKNDLWMMNGSFAIERFRTGMNPTAALAVARASREPQFYIDVANAITRVLPEGQKSFA